MNNPLYFLMQNKLITPMSYYFSEFIQQQSGERIDSILCLSAALVSEQLQQGDLCIDLSTFAQQRVFDTGEAVEPILMPALDAWKSELLKHDCVAQPLAKQPLILDGHFLYIGRFWHYEDSLAASFKQRLSQPSKVDDECLKAGLARLFSSNDESSVDWQKLAAAIAVTQPLSVISGGPGTGKTTTLVKIISLLLEQNKSLKIQLCAPTGKAAIRMLDAINSRKKNLDIEPELLSQFPQKAKTIHRLLAYRQGKFTYHSHNQLAIDCLIIDEASMIDIQLMVSLVNALPNNCKIILLGDKDQLSSVEAGDVFNDVCGAHHQLSYSASQAKYYAQLCAYDVNVIPCSDSIGLIQNAIAPLKTSYRFAQHSGIGQLADAVNKGQGDAALALFTEDYEDIKFKATKEKAVAEATMELILKHYAAVVTANSVEQAFHCFNQFQVLCALREGYFGVNQLNSDITEKLTKRFDLPVSGPFNGLPIIINENNYDLNLFNGDVGLVWKIDQHYYAFFEQADGELMSYPLVSLSRYESAWAITVHKSQGSEYESVVLVLPSDQTTLSVKKALIYTAITRAKEHFLLSADAKAFVHFCGHQTKRNSNLSLKLGWPAE